MGFLDFLHGRPMESEAESYMKKRNKEYARKSAEYKRREAMSNINPTKTRCGQNSRFSIIEAIVAAFSTVVESEFKGSKSTSVRSKECPNGGTTKQRAVIQGSNKTITTAQRMNTNIHSFEPPKGCDDCNKVTSIYDGKEEALFVVDSASAKATLRTVFVNGSILRGNFEVGDRIQIITPLEVRDAVLSNIVRQNKSLSYANISSGKISFVFANCADLLIRNGDKIIKKKKSYFK